MAVPPILQVQLALCVRQIVKYDFPERWPQFVDKISSYLQNPGSWLGSLLCLYQVVKKYQYRMAERQREPLRLVMKPLLPQL